MLFVIHETSIVRMTGIGRIDVSGKRFDRSKYLSIQIRLRYLRVPRNIPLTL